MLKPRVSVIIPAYNSERYIGEAIESVLSQTYKNVECIVVNDGSTDGTSGVVRGFCNRVVFLDQENRKLPEARNTGIRHATGEFIGFLDADDRMAPWKIENQVAYLQSNMDKGAVYSRVRYFHDDTFEEFYSLNRPTPEGDILPRLVYGNFIPVHSTLIRKKLVDAIDGFREFPALEDWDFLLRLSADGCKFGFLDEISADYRMHAGGMSRDQVLMFDAKIQVISELVRLFGSELLERGIDPGVIVSYHQADYGKALILNGRTKEGISKIFEASKQDIPKRTAFILFAATAQLIGSRFLRFLYEFTFSLRKRARQKSAV